MRNLRFGWALGVCAFVLTACGTAAGPALPPPQEPAQVPAFASQSLPDRDWWRHAVFYEIYVRAFQDSDGDGHGDFRGLTQRLPYLAELGVDALWLMPIMEANSHHGYDTIDYRAVEKDYGTEADFAAFMDEARRLGLRVILDLVLNHVSDQHPLFKEALADPTGPAGQRFIFAERNLWSGGWHGVPESNLRYFGYFGSALPDWNFRNPAVQELLLEESRFWLARYGVDGYRLDAIRHLVEDRAQTANHPDTHAWLRRFHQAVKETRPEAFTVGEVWDTLEVVSRYTGDQVDVGFHFDLANSLVNAVKSGDGESLAALLDETQARLPPGAWASFLRNHDQTRVMSEFGGNEAQARLAAGLLLTLPGVPFLYYGEEIGQLGVKPDPNLRRPMQWNKNQPQFGFTTGRPFGAGFNQGGLDRDVEGQMADPGSLWHWYRRLLSLRREQAALRVGSYQPLETQDPGVFAFVRHRPATEAGPAETLVVAANLKPRPVSAYSLSLWAGPWAPGAALQAADLSPGVAGPEAPGGLAVPALEANRRGGFTAWRPEASLPGFALRVYRLETP